jgi:predicted nucleotidyltransferase
LTGEHFSADVQELLRLLQRHRVRYLIVGGEAVILHGYPRLTGDIDIFYDCTPANAARLYRALEEFWGGAVPAVDDAGDLLEPGIIVQFGRPPNRIDLLGRLGSVSFERAWRRRVAETLRTTSGRRCRVFFIGIQDLIQSKRDAGRHKDLDDVEHLTAILTRARPRKR